MNKYQVEYTYDSVHFQTGSAFTFASYSIYNYVYNALSLLFEKTGANIPIVEYEIGDMSLLSFDCAHKYLINQESIYLKVGYRWLRHRLDLIELDNSCYLNIAKDTNIYDLQVGTSFLSDYFAYFDGELNSIHLLTIDDQAYPSAQDYETYEDIPDRIKWGYQEYQSYTDNNFFD